MSMNRPLRIGLIGAGAVVKTLHAPLLKGLGGVSLEWVCDLRLDSARGVAEAYGIPFASDDLGKCPDADAVLLAVPVGARDDAWRVASARGWHVLCEKPAARTVRELDEALERMRQAGKAVSFGLLRRYYQGVLDMRELIASRAFGDPVEIWAGEGGAQARTGRGGDWYQLDARLAGGGILIETGAHLIDQVMFISGALSCHLEDYRQRSWGGAPEFDARAHGRLRMAASLEVPFSCELSRSNDLCNGLFVRFPQVVLALPPGAGSRVEVRDRGNRFLGRLDGSCRGASTTFQAFRDEWLDFIKLCGGGRAADPVEHNRLARLSVSLIEDCYARSAGRPSEGTVRGRPQL